MSHPPILLVSTLVHPERSPRYTLGEWDLLIRQARAAQLLAHLRALLRDRGLLDPVPVRPRAHLDGAGILVERQHDAVRLEVLAVRRALVPLGVPVVLLKGAAYIVGELPAADGRMLSDIDLLVPKDALPGVESALMKAGWATMHPDDYDQRYYRRWMHEIPPMLHVKRGTVLDVHHAILPETARIRADAEAMRRDVVSADRSGDVFMLSPADMILHSATHLLHEGETDKSLRDLVDLDKLLRHFAATRTDFWNELQERAARVGLVRHLFYALRYTSLVLATPVPQEAIAASASGAPAAPVRSVMDWLYRRAFRPRHPSCSDATNAVADAALYLRGHWLRMPTGLLLRHLAHKALAQLRAADEETVR